MYNIYKFIIHELLIVYSEACCRNTLSFKFIMQFPNGIFYIRHAWPDYESVALLREVRVILLPK